MGNLGTIIRTIAGLGINDLAIIEPAADIWNPKTLRATMGALFHARHECFPNFEASFRNRSLSSVLKFIISLVFFLIFGFKETIIAH